MSFMRRRRRSSSPQSESVAKTQPEGLPWIFSQPQRFASSSSSSSSSSRSRSSGSSRSSRSSSSRRRRSSRREGPLKEPLNDPFEALKHLDAAKNTVFLGGDCVPPLVRHVHGCSSYYPRAEQQPLFETPSRFICLLSKPYSVYTMVSFGERANPLNESKCLITDQYISS